MLNDRDDKYEAQDDTEYHFSDDDVTYEVDAETEKAAPETATVEPKPKIWERLSGHKRILISGGVFLLLVFVVYKMVSPTSTTQPTDITTPVAQQTPATQMAQNPPAQTATMPANQVQQNQYAEQQRQLQQQQLQQQALQQQAAQQQLAQQQQAAQQQLAQQQAQLPPVTSVSPPTQPPGTNYPSQPMAYPSQQMPTQVQSGQAINNQTMPQGTTQAGLQPGQQLPPQTIPQPPVQQAAQAQTYTPNQPSDNALAMQMPAANTSAAMQLTAERQRLMAQLNSDYVQTMNTFTNQNKNLQDQVQALNTRVASMENELNQLVRALTQTQSQSRPMTHRSPAEPVVEAQPQPRINYNVQAIIPGRAWLRAANGEIITVAEGDLLKSVGRVTKIDPYDGIVEINTGSRTISLSYGSGT